MPTVEADVAFGLGKFNLTHDEIISRVKSSLDAVGMLEYLQVRDYSFVKYILKTFFTIVHFYLANIRGLFKP